MLLRVLLVSRGALLTQAQKMRVYSRINLELPCTEGQLIGSIIYSNSLAISNDPVMN